MGHFSGECSPPNVTLPRVRTAPVRSGNSAALILEPTAPLHARNTLVTGGLLPHGSPDSFRIIIGSAPC